MLFTLAGGALVGDHAAVVLFTGFLGMVTLCFRSSSRNVKLETDTLLTPAPHWLSPSPDRLAIGWRLHVAGIAG